VADLFTDLDEVDGVRVCRLAGVNIDSLSSEGQLVDPVTKLGS
jgi:hypothetical protein